MNSAKPIGQYLVNKGIITQKQLDEALQEQKSSGEFVGVILVKKGYASEHIIAKSLSEELGLAFMDLSKYSIEASAIKLVPEEICRKYVAIPIYQAGKNLTVAMANPMDQKAIEEIRKVSNLNVRPVFSPISEIKDRIEREYGGTAAGFKEPSPKKEVEPIIKDALDIFSGEISKKEANRGRT